MNQEIFKINKEEENNLKKINKYLYNKVFK